MTALPDRRACALAGLLSFLLPADCSTQRCDFGAVSSAVPRDFQPRNRVQAARQPVGDQALIQYEGERGGAHGHDYFRMNPAVCSDLVLTVRYDRSPGAQNGRPLRSAGRQVLSTRERARLGVPAWPVPTAPGDGRFQGRT